MGTADSTRAAESPARAAGTAGCTCTAFSAPARFERSWCQTVNAAPRTSKPLAAAAFPLAALRSFFRANVAEPLEAAVDKALEATVDASMEGADMTAPAA